MATEKEAVKSLGERLREERLARNASLEEMSRDTKISIHLLLAMENDEWDSLPGGIFTRNFIRLYTGHLGLDTEEWVADFKRYVKDLRRAAGEEDEEERATKPRVEVPKAWFYALLVAVIALLVGGYLIISYLRPAFKQQDDLNPPENGVANIAPTLARNEQSGSAVLTVELLKTVDDYCEYKYYADGDTLTPRARGKLLQNTSVILSANEKIELHITTLRGIVARWDGQDKRLEDLPSASFTDQQGNVTHVIVISR
jgi:transcriptional regulator with XRE-family HTH domain